MSAPTSDHVSTVVTEQQLAERSKDVWFYDADLDVVPPKAQELLENYSHIPSAQVKQHVYEIREKAWQIHPYPCIGGWRFLSLNLCTTPQYDEVLERVRAGERLLDLGCCFGQELRRLVYDGAPAASLLGFDLRADFFALGEELFRDGDRFAAATMIAGDVFEPQPRLGRLGIIYAGSFFHLFDRPRQLYLAKVVGTLLEPVPGSMVLGRQVGNRTPGEFQHSTNPEGKMFRHDEQSWRDMWDEAGREQGIEWDVQVELIEKPRPGGRTMQELRFCVRRK